MRYKNCGRCPYEKEKECDCTFSVNITGLCDPTQITFTTAPATGTSTKFMRDYNWTEISVPEVLTIPIQKPDLENIDKVQITAEVLCSKLIETPKYLTINTATTPNLYTTSPNTGLAIPLDNAEGTWLTGRKLLVEGVLKQKIVYTANVAVQSVHSAHFEVPFSAYIIVYPKFINNNLQVPTAVVDITEDFCVETCIEDVYVKALDERTIFKNVTLFLRAYPSYVC